MSENPRALVLRTIANLRHAYALQNMDRAIAEGVLAPEIRRLEIVIARFDGHHAEVSALVDAAHDQQQKLAAQRGKLAGQLRRAEATIERTLHMMEAQSPESPACAECARELAAALAELRAFHGEPPLYE